MSRLFSDFLAQARPRWTTESVGLMVLLAVGYDALAYLPYAFPYHDGPALLMWPAAGWAVGMLLYRGLHLWPGILVGSMLVHLWLIHPLMLYLRLPGTVLAPLVGAFLIGRYVDRPLLLSTLRGVAYFLLIGAGLSSLISATFGTWSLILSSRLPLDAFWDGWTTWWMGDFFGVLLMAPVVLTWGVYRRQAWPWGRLLEGVTGLLLLLGVMVLVSGLVWPQASAPVFLYLAFPPAIWLVLRFRQVGAAMATLVVSVIAVLSVNQGVGPFMNTDVTHTLLYFHSFLVMFATTALLVGAVMAEHHASTHALRAARAVAEETVAQRTQELQEALQDSTAEAERRRQALEALQQSEASLQQAQALAHIGNWHRDLSAPGGYTFSPEIYRIFGYAPGGAPLPEEILRRALDPETLDTIEALRQKALPLPLEATPVDVTLQFTITRPDGTQRHVIGRGTPVYADAGAPVGLRGTLQDITEATEAAEALRQSEAQLRALLETIPDAIFRIDADGIYLEYIPAQGFETLASPEVFIGRHLKDFFPPDLAQRTEAALTEALQQQTMQVFDYALTKSGQSRHYEARLLPYAPTEVLTIVRDITDQRHAQEAQRTQQKRIETELAQAKAGLVAKTRLATLGQVSASIAHELRNPLGAVRNLSYFLQHHPPATPEGWQEHLSLIEREVAQANRIITNLLEMSRPKLPNRTPLPLQPLVEETFARLQNGHPVTLDYQADTPNFTLRADPEQFKQVLHNLFQNAFQAFEGTPGWLRVTATGAHEHTLLEISDSGPGIPPDQQAQIFEPLFTTKAKGTGLGLAICRQIIEGHQGHIELASGDAGGTVFRILLPH